MLNFIKKLNVTDMGNNIVCYSPVTDLFNSYPIFITEKNERIYVWSQAAMKDNELIEFCLNAKIPERHYTFNSELNEIIAEKPEEICEIIYFLDKYEFIEPKEFIDVLKILVCKNIKIQKIMEIFNSNSIDSLKPIFINYKELEPDKFIKWFKVKYF